MTQSEFAKILSVSQATVSLALRDDRSISPAVRQRIQAKAEELGYRPNIIGQMLRKGKSNLLGVILPSLHHRFYAELVAELLQYAREKGYIIVPTQAENNILFEKAVRDLKNFNISEIAAIGGAEQLEMLLAADINSVMMETSISLNNTSHIATRVHIDLLQGGRDITDHLFKRGCKHPVFVGRYSKDESRYTGFIQRCEAEGIYEKRFVAGKENTLKNGYELVSKVLAEYPDTDAILAHNDEVAIGVIRRLQELGKKVPQDIMVAGFDNIPISAYHTPSLTSVGPDLQIYARIIIDELIAMQYPGYVSKNINVPCNIVARETA